MSVSKIQFRGDDAPLAFDEVLSRFKRCGCNLLVTGEVAQEVTALASRRLMGAPFEDRKRLLVLTDSEAKGVGAHLPGAAVADDDSVKVVRQEISSRSAATRAGSAPQSRTVGSDLQALEDAISEGISEFQMESDDLDPAELRLSVNSLYPLLVEHDYTEVTRFIRRVGDMVSDANGMAHYHLPVPEGSETVESVATLFDARVELRRNGPKAEQRWHVPTYGQQTNWVGL
ncbi:DUF7504 family protein [Halospeciosus flavus]|uniref:Halobacterial output domain-containing protein n=1 Tax=Halospeciosus flavus TaxID=3032283 RepID=A0ABD5Z4A7_9EURY|nr:hypothetical protein [Halospeciosus flavus]